jgi:hypothetical protein
MFRLLYLLRAELHRLLCILDDEGELTNEACKQIDKAREDMAQGKFISHEEIKAKYG